MTTPAYMFDYSAGASWSPRGETREQCGERAMVFFQLLRECDPTFARWFKKGWTREEALQHRVDLDAKTFAGHLEESKVLQTCWHTLFAWNGEAEEDSSGLDFICGSTNEEGREGIHFDLASTGPTGARLLTTTVLGRIMRAMVAAWEPERGIAHSSEHLDAAFIRAELGLGVGWINYYSHQLGPIPPLPPPVRMEPVEDKGILVILGDKKLTADPAHVALARQVSTALRAAGIVRPHFSGLHVV